MMAKIVRMGFKYIAHGSMVFYAGDKEFSKAFLFNSLEVEQWVWFEDKYDKILGIV